MLSWLGDDTVLWTTPGVDRLFCRCLGCGNVFPHYDAVYRAGERKTIGCRTCGGVKYSPANFPTLTQAWWLLVRGWLIRKVLLRKDNWDPRMPSRVPHE